MSFRQQTKNKQKQNTTGKGPILQQNTKYSLPVKMSEYKLIGEGGHFIRMPTSNYKLYCSYTCNLVGSIHIRLLFTSYYFATSTIFPTFYENSLPNCIVLSFTSSLIFLIMQFLV